MRVILKLNINSIPLIAKNFYFQFLYQIHVILKGYFFVVSGNKHTSKKVSPVATKSIFCQLLNIHPVTRFIHAQNRNVKRALKGV